MSIIAKYKFDSSIYADLIPEFNSEFTSDLYTVTDEVDSENSNHIIRTIESDSLPTLMRFGSVDASANSYSKSLLQILNMNTHNLITALRMFRYCTNLTSINCDWNTSKITDLRATFEGCLNLEILDTNWDTSNVTNMSYCFHKCNKLTTLNLSSWNTKKVTDISYISNLDKLTSLDISNFTILTNTNTTGFLSFLPDLTDIGMLYCDKDTINKVASLLPTGITQTIWVEDVDVKDLTPVEGVEFKQYAKNTEIMLTSPLLEGDKLIVKDGKLYHYHKMCKVVLDGSEDWKSTSDENILVFYYLQTNVPLNANRLICDKFKTTDETCNNYGEVHYGGKVNNRNGNIVFSYDSKDVTTWKNWLSENPTTIIYELAEPYYELISEDPLTISLIAESSDITNSSNIPLNMTINNKGLATVAMSPSTTYTVAFDKDTDSEVVVNLCGNEVTTTDNIVEITTPSEIDDELIFYGDGEEISNVRLLEGSVSGDSVPRETFEGLKSSFEDGYIPEPIFTNIEGGIVNSASLMAQPFTEIRNGKFYTLHIEVTENTLNSLLIWELTPTYGQSRLYVQPGETGIFTCVVETPGSAVANTVWQTTNVGNGTSVTTKEGSATVKNLIILEGDWTHLTEEDWNNLGKYKVEYKVTGKNKFDGELLQGAWNTDTAFVNTPGYVCTKNRIKVKPSTDYIISGNLTLTSSVVFIGKNGEYLGLINYNDKVYFTTPNNCEYVKIDWHRASGVTPNEFTNLQLEEGTVATSYESYKEYTKTFYLSSPLLEGDTIEDVNGVATHVKRYGKVTLTGDEEIIKILDNNYGFSVYNVSSIGYSAKPNGEGFCDRLPYSNFSSNSIENRQIVASSNQGNKFAIAIEKSNIDEFINWLKSNPVTVVSELASPIYEPISEEPILCDSYTNGCLDFDSNVPIEKVNFLYWYTPVTYVQDNTTYILQFVSDNVGVCNWVSIGGTRKFNIPVTKGMNRISITTVTNSNRVIGFSGIGFNASNIQVVATDRDVDFGYFNGLQSSFESKLVTDEADENYGKYKVECKIVGKNKATLHEEGCYYNCDNGFKKSSTTHDSYIALVEPSKTYIVSFENVDRVEISNLCFWDSSMNFIKGLTFNHGNLTFTTPYNAKFITIAVNKLAVAFQLEEGTQATSYEPYQEYTKTIYLNSPLLKGDTIEVHNGKLCHYHKMGNEVLDGSEDWVSLNDSEGIIRFYFKDQENTSNLKQKCFSDRFPYSISSVNDHEYIYKDSNLIIGIHSSKLPTIDISGFKQWLQANPTTVVYELVNPYYEEIEPTQEDLIITSVKEGDLHIDTIVPISSKVTYNVNVQLLTDFEQSIVEQVQATQTTDLQSILDEEIDN